MPNITIIARENEQIKKLQSKLLQRGLACSIVFAGEEAARQVAEQSPSLILADIDRSLAGYKLADLLQKINSAQHLPIIALIPEELIDKIDSILTVDDFVVEPWKPAEVGTRIKRILGQADSAGSKDLIKRGDLVIDLAKCEVSVGNRLLTLTFREYELLRFLASKEGRVFSREALLNEVWGYDYYGGDRTVDVHIRRLRSKIEDSTHTFIETVRGIGYKFKR